MKLKPVPEKNQIFQEDAIVVVNKVEIDLAIKQNEIIVYQDYLRQTLQDMEDMRHG